MKSKVLSVLAVLLLTTVAPAQLVTSIVPDGKVHKFEARDRQFFIDGQPTLLAAGEMHFGRVLPEDWDARIKQAKALGLNTMAFYLFWNMCEPEEGKFNFTGMTDVRKMVQLCQENGMWVVLRPGPYCCAEVEYGGIPWWTAKYPDVPIRSTHPKWLEWCKRYTEAVYKEVADLQVTRGGPIVMVQMDNEFGMIAQGDQSYIGELQKIFEGVGFNVQLFVCESGGPSGQSRPGVLRGPNGYRGARGGRAGGPGGGPGGAGRGGQPEAPPPLVEYPVFVPEVYSNWFTGWGQPLATRNKGIAQIVDWTASLIDQNASFNLYVFHGGTTYGYWTGANEYLPLVNSYDYGAPIDEAGRTTQKYWALREMMINKLKITPPAPPPEPLVVDLPATPLTQYVPLLETLPAQPTKVDAKALPMEALDQGFGFVLYRKKFENGLKGTLVLNKPMDYAVVMVNGKTVGKAFRGYGPESNTIALPETTGAATLDILVHNLGRISVITASWTQDRAVKGLIDGASLDGQMLSDWEMYSLPMETTTSLTGWKQRPAPAPAGRGGPAAQAAAPIHTGPTLYRGTFNVHRVGGTFLDMRNWGMGVAWVNGHNLGRHWDRGGLRSLFVPGHWLKQGENEIVILELHDAPAVAQISGGTNIIDVPNKPFAVTLDSPASFGGRRGGPGGRGRGPATAPATAPVGN